MRTTEVIDMQDGQLVKLPEEFRFCGPRVSIRKVGEAVILEPMILESPKPTTWPPGFFEELRIDDPAFVRPAQVMDAAALVTTRSRERGSRGEDVP